MTEHDPKSAPQPPDDLELEDFLAGRGPLARAQREDAREQAPPELDARVLAAAREELRRAVPRRRLLRWDGPLALAASTVLVLGLGWMVQQQVRRPAAMTEAELAPPAPAPVSAPSVASNAPAPVAIPPGEPMPPPRKEQPALKERRTAQPAAKPSAPPATNNVAAPAPMQDSAPSDYAPAAPAPPPPAAAGAVNDQPSAALAQQARDRMEQQDEARAGQSAPTVTAEPLPPPAEPMAAESMAAESMAKSAAPAPSSIRAYGAAPQADPCASPQRPAHSQQDADAQAWLERIRGLRAANPAAARAELACFSSRHPRAAIPDDLKALLEDSAPSP